MSKLFSPLAVIAALSMAPTVALADNADRSGAYGVIGLGKPKVAAHGKKMDPQQEKQKVGNSKLAYTFGTGYRVNDYFAVEADFFGQTAGKKSKSRGNDNANARGKNEVGALKSRAYTVSGLAILPLGDSFELYGRAGVGRMTTTFTPALGNDMGKARSSGMATQFGVGANFHVGENSFLRTEWSTLRGKGNDDVAKVLGRDKMRSSQVMVSYGHTF